MKVSSEMKKKKKEKKKGKSVSKGAQKLAVQAVGNTTEVRQSHLGTCLCGAQRWDLYYFPLWEESRQISCTCSQPSWGPLTLLPSLLLSYSSPTY